MTFSTERLARACAVHPKRTVAAWGAVVVVSFAVIAVLLGSALTSDGDVTSNTESKQAAALIRASFPPAPTPSEIVVVRSDRYTVDEPAFRAKLQALAERGKALGAVAGAQRTARTTATRWTAATMVPLVCAATTSLRWSRSSSRRAAGRLRGRDHRLADGRRRLREALRGGSAEGRAADRAARGADRAAARVRRGRGRAHAGRCSALVSIVVALALTALVGQAFEVSSSS